MLEQKGKQFQNVAVIQCKVELSKKIRKSLNNSGLNGPGYSGYIIS